jgi:hypothetical protein
MQLLRVAPSSAISSLVRGYKSAYAEPISLTGGALLRPQAASLVRPSLSVRGSDNLVKWHD